jgi:pimeloyl-ACP methyl ester carboxylesterase
MMSLLARMAPAWTARAVIARILRTRRPLALGAPELRTGARRVELDLGEHRGLGFVMGEGPRVYLLHGWDGSAADLAPIAGALADHGFRAVVLEAPGHGEAPGATSNVVLLARTLEAAIAAEGPAHAVVAHSFGGAAAVLARSLGVRVGRVALVAPEPEPGHYIDAAGAIGGESFRRRLHDEMRRRVGLAPSEVGFSATLGDLRPLVIHDLRDRQVPFRRIVRAVPRVLRTEGLGHRRVLTHPAVVRAVVDYVSSGNERSCPHGYVDGACATCALEQELFRPALRLVS